MTELEIREYQKVEPFDRFTLNVEHRLDFEDGDLTAAWPSGADVREYQAAIFPVSEGTVELPDGAAVLSVGESVAALVPTDAYQGGEGE